VDFNAKLRAWENQELDRYLRGLEDDEIEKDKCPNLTTCERRTCRGCRLEGYYR